MRLLLDSHTFVWWRDKPNKLSQTAFEEISSPNNSAFLSVVTIWELQIKIQLNKLDLKGNWHSVIEEERRTNNFQILPANLSHVLEMPNLPLHHKDPFDRLLISQAIVENMTLVSSDKQLSKYQVNLLW